MNKLNELNYLLKMKLNLKEKLYLAHDEPGEGEHKILQYLKNKPKNNKESKCIYGLDADLIMLS